MLGFYDMMFRFTSKNYDPDNELLNKIEENLSGREIMAMNIIWDHINPEKLSYYNWILALLAINTWTKLIIRI